MKPVTPSEGWGVLHLFYRIDRARAEDEPGGAKRVLDAIASLEGDDHQVVVFPVLGHKADLGVMALGPDIARLQAFELELDTSPPHAPAWSYLSLTERSQ
jgi:peroxiredoxin